MSRPSCSRWPGRRSWSCWPPCWPWPRPPSPTWAGPGPRPSTTPAPARPRERDEDGNGNGSAEDTDPAHAGVLVGLLERRDQVLNPVLLLVLVCHLAVATIVAVVAYDLRRERRRGARPPSASSWS